MKLRTLIICVVAGAAGCSLAAVPQVRSLPWVVFPVAGVVLGVAAAAGVLAPLQRRLTGILQALWEWQKSDYQTAVDFRAGDEFDALNETLTGVTEKIRTAQSAAQERADQVRSLVELSAAMSATRSPAEIHDHLLRGCLAQAGARGGALFLLDTRMPGDMTVRMVRGRITHRRLGDRVSIGEGPVGVCAERRRPVVIRPGIPDRLLSRLSVKAEQRNALYVPLTTQDEIVGVVELVEKEGASGFTQAEGEFLQALCASAAVVIQNVNLSRNLSVAFLQTVQTLAHAVDAKDAYTQFHSNRVADYALAMGRELGFKPTQLDAIQYGATLHDIGKIAISENILNKPGRLTDAEFEIMKQHPVKGSVILMPVQFPWNVIPVVRHHHERWDGKGYPDMLAATDVDLHARMTAICDTFDAMTTDRPYRAGLPVETALKEIIRCRGNQFDPDLVHVFLAAFEREGAAIMDKYDRMDREPFPHELVTAPPADR